MSEVEWKDIAAVRFGNDLVCTDCLEEKDKFDEEDILTYDDCEEGSVYFCDRCKKNIT